MARIQRRHLAGEAHHAGARGIGRRSIFDNSLDCQRYEELMRKHLETMYPDVRLLSYCLMTNHTHLFLFGVVEALSRFMKALHQEYVQIFNATRGRSGSLFQGRFWSRPCGSHHDLLKTVHYIDQNPVVAGIAADSGLYAWGSGGDYIQGWGSMPLARDEMRLILEPEMSAGLDFSAAYRSRFGSPMSQRDFSALTERYRKEGARRKNQLEMRDYCSPEYHAEMDELAWFADRIQVLSRRMTLSSEVEAHMKASDCEDDLRRMLVVSKGPAATGFELLQVALLREVCVLTNREIASELSVSPSMVRRRLEKHHAWMKEDGPYANSARKVLAGLLAAGEIGHSGR